MHLNIGYCISFPYKKNPKMTFIYLYFYLLGG